MAYSKAQGRFTTHLPAYSKKIGMKKNQLIFTLLCFFLFSGWLKAQVSIAPSFVFIDKNNGVGNLYVSNNSDKEFEVSISFVFGYPDSDARGNLVMNYADSVAYKSHALDEMIRAFPRSFILKGKEQRTVRIQVIPAHRRKEGYFFTRMKVLAKPLTAEVAETTGERIGAQINFNFEQITAVFYHRGAVSTGVIVEKVEVRQEEGHLRVLPQLKRTGNSPFLGSMIARLKNSQGAIVAEMQSTTTVYFDEIRRLDMRLDQVPPGSYSLELTFETKRNDMMSENLVQAPPVVHVTKVEIN